MRIRFILRTRGCVKTLGSVMDAAVARGHEIAIQVYAVPFRDPPLTGDYVRWPSQFGLWQIPDATVAHRIEDFVGVVDTGLKVVVPVFWEFLMRPAVDYADAMLCYPSYEAREAHHETGWPVTGWTMADHASMIPPMPRDSHVFFSMKRNVSSRGLPIGWYLTTALLDRDMAHRRGLRWDVKTRPKHRDPLWLRCLADSYFDDTNMYPHSSQTLLSMAASMSHFTSGAVAEAVLHNVPTLWYRRADHRVHLNRSQRQPDDYLQPWRMDRETYIRRFLGWADGQNGARVIEAIERRVGTI